MNVYKTIERQRKTIERLTKENTELKNALNSLESFLNEFDTNRQDSFESAKNMMLICEEIKQNYEKEIAKTKNIQNEYRKLMDDCKKLINCSFENKN